MTDVKADMNPVGEVVKDEGILHFIEAMKRKWDNFLVVAKAQSPGWKFWKSKRLVPVTTFLLKALDDLISYVDEMDLMGPDKKATVLWAVGVIYDYVVRQAMPVWLKPFAGAVRVYVITVLLAAAIDWIVEKYRDGSWRKPAAEWAEVKAQLFGVPGDHRPKIG